MGVYALEAVKLAQTGEQQKCVAASCGRRIDQRRRRRYAYDHALAVEKVVAQVNELKLSPNAIFTTWSPQAMHSRLDVVVLG